MVAQVRSCARALPAVSHDWPSAGRSKHGRGPRRWTNPSKRERSAFSRSVANQALAGRVCRGSPVAGARVAKADAKEAGIGHRRIPAAVLFNNYQHPAAAFVFALKPRSGEPADDTRFASQAVSRTTNAIPAQEMPTIRHISFLIAIPLGRRSDGSRHAKQRGRVRGSPHPRQRRAAA